MSRTPKDAGKNLPEGWRLCKLKDIGEIVSGGTPSTKEQSFWGDDINWITPADLSGYSNKYIAQGRKSITEKGLKSSSAKLLPKGTVLFSSRAPIGYVAIASDELSTNQGFKSIISGPNISNEYLYYYLKGAKDLAEKYSSGTTFKEISASAFKELPIPVPPVSVQQRIVSKIEELFSELDKSIEQLKTAQQQLKVYRQAVLKWAFEGMYAGNMDGWKNFKLSEASIKIVVGYVGPVTEHITRSNGIYFLSTTHIGDNELLAHDIRLVTKAFNEKNKKSRVVPGDIIIARHGDSGKACIIPEWIREAQVSNAVILRVNPEIALPKFICLRLNYERQTMQKMKVGGVHQVVNTKSMEGYEVLLPPVDDQEQILKEIQKRLTVADELEEAVTKSLQDAEINRQSILKKAFEGKLSV